MSAKPAEGLKQLLDEFRISAGTEKALQFKAFLSLLLKWSQRMNLTASTDWDFLKPFFWEGMWAAGFYPESASRHLDIGSGAGFPIIPMAILAPHAKVEMVESREKRAYFLENAVRELGLAHASVHQARLLDLRIGEGQAWDCFSWKAIRLNTLELEWIWSNGKPGSTTWMFHGREMAVEDPVAMGNRFQIVKVELFPGRKEWKLSIFKNVSRETEPRTNVSRETTEL
jgi:16S rRNA (guanine(527)-N(7))-methyltransferase RsmG